MWIMIFLGGWLLVSLILSPVIGRFVLTHLKITDDVETLNIRAREVGLERQAASVAVLDQRSGKTRLTPN